MAPLFCRQFSCCWYHKKQRARFPGRIAELLNERPKFNISSCNLFVTVWVETITLWALCRALLSMVAVDVLSLKTLRRINRSCTVIAILGLPLCRSSGLTNSLYRLNILQMTHLPIFKALAASACIPPFSVVPIPLNISSRLKNNYSLFIMDTSGQTNEWYFLITTLLFLNFAITVIIFIKPWFP